MPTILDEICATKADHVAAMKAKRPHGEILASLTDLAPTRGFTAALKHAVNQGHYGLICEVKKASPSRGLIREDFNPVALAKEYQAGGATCLSVLTDQPYFQGHDQFLKDVRAAVSLPVLRKDFMIDLYQIDESRLLGADCILLILSALSDAQAKEMEDRAHELGMDVLIEVHDQKELERAAALKSPLVGVNNRNLKTMEQNLDTSVELASGYPLGRLPISESALKSPSDLVYLSGYGYDCFLIGETFMRQADVMQAVRAFQKGNNA